MKTTIFVSAIGLASCGGSLPAEAMEGESLPRGITAEIEALDKQSAGKTESALALYKSGQHIKYCAWFYGVTVESIRAARDAEKLQGWKESAAAGTLRTTRANAGRLFWHLRASITEYYCDENARYRVVCGAKEYRVQIVG